MNTTTIQAQPLTLLDLVQALGSVLDNDAAVASAVGTLVNAGAVKFQGDLAGRRVRIVPSLDAMSRLAA